MPQMPKTLDGGSIKEFLDKFDTVLTDCDGVLWLGNDVIGKANETINRLQALGKKVFYVTNNSTKSRHDYMEKCKKLGFQATKDDIVSTSYVLAEYLRQQNFKQKVYVMGTPGIGTELENAGIPFTGVDPEPLKGDVFDLKHMKLEEGIGAVAVGFDPNISFPRIMRAASHLVDPSCLFLATNTDEHFPIGNSQLRVPGTGSMVRAVETVAGRPPIVMGKPSTLMFEVVKDRFQLDPSRTIMIGDRCNTDILFGKNCEMAATVVVLSGITSEADLAAWAASDDPKKHQLLADYVVPELGDLLPLLN